MESTSGTLAGPETYPLSWLSHLPTLLLEHGQCSQPLYITQFSLDVLYRVASSFPSRRCEGICGPPFPILLSLPFGSVGAGAGPCVLELDPGCVPQLLGQAPLVL